ncbi:MAG: LacI family DNA-binding transcriptional regulator [Rhizobiales bacterium]|nr:LacI family DNA-binding transcriptional regulator [Hyphomicrobiales bacterium]
MTGDNNITEVARRTRRRRTGAAAKKPTVADIARAAGVSTATVSRALNKPDAVSAKLRNKVARKVRELGYVPSGAARALASNRSFTIGTVIPTLNNAIFAASVDAFEETLSRHGYTLLVTVSNYDRPHEIEQVRRLLERGVDGLMLIGLDHPEEVWQMIERSACPAVAIWGHNDKPRVPCIGFDNAAAAEHAVDHLVELGHRRIGMVAGLSFGNDRARARRAGVERALAKHGLPVVPALFTEKAYSHDYGRDGLTELLSHGAPPTAIMCGNDVLAMGVMFEARDRGIAIPDDLSVVGFDNLPITSQLRPALTTIEVPSVPIGMASANAIVAYLTDGSPIQSKSFPAPFVMRATTQSVR